MGMLQQQVEESAELKSTPTKASKRFKRVCVFCGSSSGNGTVYSNVALNLGRELVRFFMISSYLSLNFLCQLTVAVVTMVVSICVIEQFICISPNLKYPAITLVVISTGDFRMRCTRL